MKRISIENVCLHCCCLINFFSLCLRSGVTLMEFQTTTWKIKAKPKHKSRLWNSSRNHFSFIDENRFNNGCMLYETCSKPYERWCYSLKLLETEIWTEMIYVEFCDFQHKLKFHWILTFKFFELLVNFTRRQFTPLHSIS